MKTSLLFLLFFVPMFCVAQTKPQVKALSADEQEYRAFIKLNSTEGAKAAAFYKATPAAKRNTGAFKNEYQTMLNQAGEQRLQLITTWVKGHPNSTSSLSAIKSYGQAIGELNDSLRKLFELLSADLQQSPDGQALAVKLAKYRTPDIGSLAPAIEQQDVDGKTISLAAYKGKYVLIDFWASWCVPCRQRHPDLLSTYQKFRNKNFDILGVSLDRSNGKASWVAAIKKDKLPWTQVTDLQGFDNAAAKAYHITAIPQSFLIGPDGTVVAKDLSDVALDKMLEKVLGR